MHLRGDRQPEPAAADPGPAYNGMKSSQRRVLQTHDLRVIGIVKGNAP
jgi:hypothetical protein